MITIVGRIADNLGHCRWDDNTIEIIPADGYRASQPSCIPLDVDHDEQAIGEVIALEERDGGLFAVATSDVDDLVSLDGPVYFSPLVRHRNGTDAELLAVALTYTPGTVGQLPVVMLAGPPAEVALELRWGRSDRDLIEHAVAFDRARRDRDQPIRITTTRRAVPEWRASLSAAEVEWSTPHRNSVISVR